MNYQLQVVTAFADVGMPILNHYLQINSCVASTRVTIECLKHFSITAIPRPMKWVVEFTDEKLIYATGLNKEELSGAIKVSDCPFPVNDPWAGHLVAFTNETLIDPSFNQALVGTNHKPATRMVMFPLRGVDHLFEGKLEYIAITDHDEPIKVTYLTTDDYSWTGSISWTDPELKTIEHLIISRMTRKLTH